LKIINNNSTGKVTVFERDEARDAVRLCSHCGENVFQNASMALSEGSPGDDKSTWSVHIKRILAREERDSPYGREDLKAGPDVPRFESGHPDPEILQSASCIFEKTLMLP
jgi:hypothetical protein